MRDAPTVRLSRRGAEACLLIAHTGRNTGPDSQHNICDKAITALTEALNTPTAEQAALASPDRVARDLAHAEKLIKECLPRIEAGKRFMERGSLADRLENFMHNRKAYYESVR